MELDLFAKLENVVVDQNLDPTDIEAVKSIVTEYETIQENIKDVIMFAEGYDKQLGFSKSGRPLQDTIYKMKSELRELHDQFINKITGHVAQKYSLNLSTDFLDDLDRKREEPYTEAQIMEWLETENRELNFVEQGKKQVMERFLGNFRRGNFRATKNTITLGGYIGKESYWSSTPELDRTTYKELLEGLSLFEFGSPNESRKFDVMPGRIVTYQANYETQQAKITQVAFYQNSNCKLTFSDARLVGEFVSFFSLAKETT